MELIDSNSFNSQKDTVYNAQLGLQDEAETLRKKTHGFSK